MKKSQRGPGQGNKSRCDFFISIIHVFSLSTSSLPVFFSYTLQQHADSWKNGIRYWYRSFNSDLYEKDGYLDDPKPKKGGEVEKEEAKVLKMCTL